MVLPDVNTFVNLWCFCFETEYSQNFFLNWNWHLLDKLNKAKPLFSFTHPTIWACGLSTSTQVILLSKWRSNFFLKNLAFSVHKPTTEIQWHRQLINMTDQHSWQHKGVLLATCDWELELLESHKFTSINWPDKKIIKTKMHHDWWKCGTLRFHDKKPCNEPTGSGV